MKQLRTSLIVTVLFTTHCGDDTPASGGGEPQGGASSSQGGSGAGGGGGATGGGASGGGLAIEWTPCPLFSDATAGDDAFCASIPVPLDWNDPTGETIDFFVKKVPASDPNPRGQLWLLNGGPGYSGADFEGGIQAKTVDIYLPDHRGTGRSSRLGCPEFESDDSDGGYWVTDPEMQGCADAVQAEWGERLDGFTITNAARDVGEVIAATSTVDDDILIDGGSYGSIWANRYLQIYPDQADGVVMDAFAVGLLLTRDDVYFDELGERLMDACATTPACGEHFAGDPWAEMTDLVNDLEAGSCPAIVAQGWTRQELHVFWSFFLYTWEYRSLIAPMVYRMSRCEPRDVAALQNLHDVFTQPQPVPASQRYFSMMLSTHILLSELWEDPAPSLAELEDIQANATIAHGIAVTAQSLYPTWPRYPKDAYADAFAESATPVLMISGEYDFIPRASIDPAVEHFSNGGNFLEVPNAPHNPYAAPNVGGGLPCAAAVRGVFFADPNATLDMSCTEDVAPLPLVPPSDLSSAAFGAADPWDGTPPGTPMNVSPTQMVSAARALAAWRRR